METLLTLLLTDSLQARLSTIHVQRGLSLSTPDLTMPPFCYGFTVICMANPNIGQVSGRVPGVPISSSTSPFMATMSTHVLAKRDVNLGFGGIIGIVVGGLVVINMVLFVAWCVIRRRNVILEKESQRESMGSSTYGDIESMSIFSKSSMASVQNASYLQVMRTLQTTTAPHPKVVVMSTSNKVLRKPASSQKPSTLTVPHSSRSSHSSRSGEPKKRKHRSSHAKMPKPSLPRPIPPAVTVSRSSSRAHPTLRRTNSLDSASIYSTASAPREFHDTPPMPQPFALDPSPSFKPSWAPRLTAPPVLIFREPPSLSPAPVPSSLRPEGMYRIAEELSIISSDSSATCSLFASPEPPRGPLPANLRAYYFSSADGHDSDSGSAVQIPVSSPPGATFGKPLPPTLPLRIRPRAYSDPSRTEHANVVATRRLT
ncbi:hypothetical protein EVG20_g7378 [Dentipellis fragilis]|uniref:Transmembrane protein n=1 Tax=Dentipellis fragilis TaxID=205917 RepID=A0A4Y9YEC7_9AGAM|nr:hypothetical protein EVG20_g7378 [Dentipellis fragilis]